MWDKNSKSWLLLSHQQVVLAKTWTHDRALRLSASNGVVIESISKTMYIQYTQKTLFDPWIFSFWTLNQPSGRRIKGTLIFATNRMLVQMYDRAPDTKLIESLALYFNYIFQCKDSFHCKVYSFVVSRDTPTYVMEQRIELFTNVAFLPVLQSVGLNSDKWWGISQNLTWMWWMVRNCTIALPENEQTFCVCVNMSAHKNRFHSRVVSKPPLPRILSNECLTTTIGSQCTLIGPCVAWLPFLCSSKMVAKALSLPRNARPCIVVPFQFCRTEYK